MGFSTVVAAQGSWGNFKYAKVQELRRAKAPGYKAAFTNGNANSILVCTVSYKVPPSWYTVPKWRLFLNNSYLVMGSKGNLVLRRQEKEA